MLFTLLFLLTTSAQASGLLSMCFMHDLAFPNGPEAADLSQNLCHLIQENMPEANLHCEEQTSMTGSTFIESYSQSEALAQFCEDNADLVSSVLHGMHPEAEHILDVAFAEGLVLTQIAEGGDESRRNLFVDKILPAIGHAGNAIMEFDHGLFFFLVYVLGIALLVVILYGLAWVAGRRNRRALEGSSVSTSVHVITNNNIMMECIQGIDSFLCEMPVNDLLQVFSTGICASVGGLMCVFSEEDLLALLPPSN